MDEWISPTGGSGWSYNERARDDNMGTCAYVCLPAWTWSGFIEFTHAALTCNKIRLYITRDDGTFTTLIAEVYYGGAYHQIYNATPTYGAWNELPIGSYQSVTKMRFNVYHTSGSGYPCVAIYECDFWWGNPNVTIDIAGILSGAETIDSAGSLLIPIDGICSGVKTILSAGSLITLIDSIMSAIGIITSDPYSIISVGGAYEGIGIIISDILRHLGIDGTLEGEGIIEIGATSFSFPYWVIKVEAPSHIIEVQIPERMLSATMPDRTIKVREPWKK